MDWKKYLKEALLSIYKKEGYGRKMQDFYLKENERILKILQGRLNYQIYKFGLWTPVLRKEKKNGKLKERIIIKPDFFDKIVLKAICLYINPLLAPCLKPVDKYSFAYQKGKSSRDALLRIKKLYRPGNVILKLDIKSFFDNINPKKVIEILGNMRIKMNMYILTLIKDSLSLTLENNNNYEKACASIMHGIPQGSPVSSILSNLYLLEFDKKCADNKLKMVRYADDMVFILKNKKQAEHLYKEIKDYLKINLELDVYPLEEDNEKTLIYNDLSNKPLLFLGILFDGYTLLPTSDKLNNLEKAINTILGNKKFNNENKVALINEKIHQWCGYFSFTDIDKKTLDNISTRINKKGHKKLGNKIWKIVNIWDIFVSCRNLQNNKKRLRFEEEYDWVKY